MVQRGTNMGLVENPGECILQLKWGLGSGQATKAVTVEIKENILYAQVVNRFNVLSSVEEVHVVVTFCFETYQDEHLYCSFYR